MTKWIRDQAIEQGGRLGPHKIQLWCPKCGRHRIGDKAKTDYPEAVAMEFMCPECVGGDFDNPTFWDRMGNEVFYDPAEIGTEAHPWHPGLLAAIAADEAKTNGGAR